jgi:virulence-associated protein VagC
MTMTIAAQMTPEGLLIPRAALGDWDEVEVLREKQRIIIQPQALSPTQERELVIQALRQDGLLVEMAGEPLSPPVTPEERAELAKKLSVGRPLSEIIIEERRAGW